MKKIILLLILCLFMIPSASAVLLGVNKMSIDYSDVLRSGYAEDSVIISTGSADNVSLYMEAQGDIKDWISFNPNETDSLIMNANAPATVKIMIRPPSDARSGEYHGIVLISTGQLGQQSGKIGTNIEVAFQLEINVNVTDTEILSCSAGGMDFRDVEIGDPLEFSASVANSGNVRSRPSFSINILDKNQKKVVEVLTYTWRDEILPTMMGTQTAKLEHQLNVGQYWAQINSSCGSGGLLTFSVLEKGGISDVGEFVRLENFAWAKTEEIVPIIAHFRNRGTREVSAQFKGIITLDEKIVKIISSDKVDVASGEIVALETYFTPEEIGQYKISGRVTYNNKLTYEKSSMLNVEQGLPASTKNIYYWALIIIIFAIILLLAMIIRKKKKKLANKSHK